MKASWFLACAIALLALGSSPAQAKAAAASSAPLARASAHDWSMVVKQTPEGGFVMGNPAAPVKLIEYGSMTCPHCAHFDEDAVPSLIADYVKGGRVSFEFRNFVRDESDVSASLIARCAGTRGFFPLTRALFKDQQAWEKKIGDAPSAQLTRIYELPPTKQFLALAKLAGFPQLAAAHGVPASKSSQCLTDEKSIARLTQMADEAKTAFPDFAGTPTFVINGTMVEFGAITAAEVWPTLESHIQSALGQPATAISSTNGADN